MIVKVDFHVASRRERWKAFERGIANAGIVLHSYTGGPAVMGIGKQYVSFRFFPENVHVKFNVDNQYQFDAVAEIAPTIEAEGITVIINKQFFSDKEKEEAVVSQADIALADKVYAQGRKMQQKAAHADEEACPSTPDPEFKRYECECGYVRFLEIDESGPEWYFGGDHSRWPAPVGRRWYCPSCGSLLGPGGWALLAGRDPKEVQWPEEAATDT